MKQSCLTKINQIRDVFTNLVDGLDMLHNAIEDESEDQVDQAMDMLPVPAHVAKTLEKFSTLVSAKPWEDKRKKANA